MQKTPTIFLSYSRANADVADSIDNDFKSIGITFRRDIRDVAYRSNIKDFMNTIGESDFVLMLVSDEFLKSDWCMYEVTELLNTHKFHHKILPVVLENANPIFKPNGRLPYYEFWNNLVEEYSQLITKYPNDDLIEVLRRYKNAVNYIGDFFTSITKLNLLNIETLKQQNYRPILDLVGVDDKLLIEEMLAVWQTTDQEDKEIALEEFGKKYPSNSYYFFSKAFFEEKEKNFKKAKKSYEEALRINPDYVNAHINLGVLLEKHFQAYDTAKKHYEEALRINLDYVNAHNNLGVLLEKHFQAYNAAKKHYKEALRIDPNDVNAHYNLGILLMNNFQEYNGAREHYEEALRINPKNSEVHNNLGVLLMNNFQEYGIAKGHYEEALDINPKNAEAHYNLGILLQNNFQAYDTARRHYEEVLRINPKSAEAHYNLASLFATNLNDTDKAKEHYVIATQLNPTLINKELDLYFGIER